MSSYLKVMDIGLATGLYSKFGPILGLDTIAHDVLFYPKEISLRERAERQGKTELEFISYWRVSTSIDWQRSNTPAARRGVWLPTGTENESVQVKAMPVKLRYNVWFWTKDKDKINQICETYLFWQHTNPNLDLYYKDIYPLGLDLHFGEMVDESVIETKYNTGVYFVNSVPVTVDGWAFVSSDPMNDIINTIIVTCYDKDEVEEYTELIVVDSNYDEEKAVALKLFTRTITE